MTKNSFVAEVTFNVIFIMEGFFKQAIKQSKPDRLYQTYIY